MALALYTMASKLEIKIAKENRKSCMNKVGKILYSINFSGVGLRRWLLFRLKIQQVYSCRQR